MDVEKIRKLLTSEVKEDVLIGLSILKNKTLEEIIKITDSSSGHDNIGAFWKPTLSIKHENGDAYYDMGNNVLIFISDYSTIIRLKPQYNTEKDIITL